MNQWLLKIKRAAMHWVTVANREGKWMPAIWQGRGSGNPAPVACTNVKPSVTSVWTEISCKCMPQSLGWPLTFFKET